MHQSEAVQLLGFAAPVVQLKVARDLRYRHLALKLAQRFEHDGVAGVRKADDDPVNLIRGADGGQIGESTEDAGAWCRVVVDMPDHESVGAPLQPRGQSIRDRSRPDHQNAAHRRVEHPDDQSTPERNQDDGGQCHRHRGCQGHHSPIAEDECVGSECEQGSGWQATRDHRGSPPLTRPQPRRGSAVQPVQVQRYCHRDGCEGDVSDAEVAGAHRADVTKRHRTEDRGGRQRHHIGDL